MKKHPHLDFDGEPVGNDGLPLSRTFPSDGDAYSKTSMSPAAFGALVKGDFANFVTASTPGGIERQEKAGQLEQAKLQTLPRKMGDCRTTLEKLGFKFGENADDLFVNVEFPEGWSKRPTDHSMWSDLVDDKGRKRGGIFFKAAFYDRSAHMSLSVRYHITKNYEDGQTTSVFILDTATNERLCARDLPTEPSRDASREDRLAYYDACDAVENEVKADLKAKFPDYNDVLAYW